MSEQTVELVEPAVAAINQRTRVFFDREEGLEAAGLSD
jgi:hypothetical protein